ncbi:DUF6470 family protein [Rossellomorea marisflavi]|uniref:DUF6470 family protein n=1 Tax=Rossellomorea marisflavi TaxID=189381 RepID=UPI00279E8C53|nr:DUF6470 family protein [Rossellomorea marisflavi]UTE73594.1 DUF6470 family protein [Rossellomorea marisflavi]
MHVPQIRMSQVPAKLGIDIEPASISIQQPAAVMELHQEGPVMTMDTTLPQLSIDQSQAWEDMNLKSALRSIEEAAGEGYQAWLEFLGNKAQDGDELMSIEAGTGAIASQAERNSQSPNYEFNIGYIPSPFSVKTYYQPGSLNIQVQNRPVQNQTTPQKPIISYHPGRVTYSIQQHQQLTIETT